MSKVFFIADTHFGEDAIRRYENRPFDSVEAMDRALVERWNAVVEPEDTVWHLGDFGAAGREAELLAALHGRKRLILGNHDTAGAAFYREVGFEEVYDLPVLYRDFWLLSHVPLYVNRNMPYANIFGHVHANPQYMTRSAQHYCVSVERLNYAPLDFEELARRVKEAAR
jgi:calcineurin-like phosphoesterase family protein